MVAWQCIRDELCWNALQLYVATKKLGEVCICLISMSFFCVYEESEVGNMTLGILMEKVKFLKKKKMK